MDILFHPSQGEMYALGWMLLHSFWIGALIATVTALLLKAVSVKKAVLRYRIAWGALGLFLLVNSWTFWAYWPEATNSQVIEQVANNKNIVLTFTERPNQLKTIERYIAQIEAFLPQLVYGWSIGLLFFLLRFLVGFRQMQQCRRKGLLPIPDSWQQRFLELAKEMGVKSSNLRLGESLRTKVPILIGHFKPLVLLPAGTLTQTPPEYIEAVLKHELAHIRRNDFLTSVIQNFIEVVFYFNPFVWWMSARIREEREHCCDDLAIQHACRPGTYAKALFHFRQMVEEPYPVQAVAFLKKRSQLLSRLQRLLLPEATLTSQKKYTMEKTVFALIALSATIFLAFQTQGETTIRPEQTTMTSPPFWPTDSLPETAGGVQVLLLRGDSIKMLQGSQNKEASLIILSSKEKADSQGNTLALSGLSEGGVAIITVEDREQFALLQDSSELPEAERRKMREEAEKMRKETEKMREELERMRKEAERLKQEAEKFKYADLDFEQLILTDTIVISHPDKQENDTVITYTFDPNTIDILSIVFETNEAVQENSSTKGLPKTFEEKKRPEMLLIKQAVFEGLIKDPDNYSFSLTPKKLVIDGKRQPKAIFERYKAKYEKLTGSPLKSSIKTKVRRQTQDVGEIPSPAFPWWNWWS